MRNNGGKNCKYMDKINLKECCLKCKHFQAKELSEKSEISCAHMDVCYIVKNTDKCKEKIKMLELALERSFIDEKTLGFLLDW